MSEPIPESVPTSSQRGNRPPTKRAKLTPTSQQSAQLDALFANPDREITIPESTDKNSGRRVAAPPEIVANVQGSSAGAGSGEFHVYKASRRREYERLRRMDEEVEEEEKEKEHRLRKEEREKEDNEKLERNRVKREKAKQRKSKAKQGRKGEADDKGAEVENGVSNADDGAVVGKRKLGGPVQLLKREDQSTGGHGRTQDETEQGGTDEEAGVTIHDDD